MLLHTPVCDLLGCEYPIILAGMGGVARSNLVTAITQAGGFGLLGMVRESPALIRTEITKVRAATKHDFGVNLIPAATPPDLFKAELDVCIEERVPAVALFWDLSHSAIGRLREVGILAICQVGSADEAREAELAGAQIIIAQGVEAGGHVRGRISRPTLIAQTVATVSIPVLAAGGIADGADVAIALRLGAQGAVVGTAFLATDESFAHDYHKRRIVEAQAGTTVHTDAFHINWPRGAYVRVLPNSVTAGKQGDPFSGERKVIGTEGQRTTWLFSTDSPLRTMTGNFEAMALYAGEGVGKIEEIIPAGQRLQKLATEAEQVLAATAAGRGAASTAVAETAPLASPVCYANEASDAYAGFATREELLAFLNEMLEAERAGARITARMTVDATDPNLVSLMKKIQGNEARWCAMLLHWIEELGGTPTRRVGEFYEKCMAISDIGERAAFINRGQGWVVRRLREMLPKVRKNEMHADFAAMLKSHAENIASTSVFLQQGGDLCRQRD